MRRPVDAILSRQLDSGVPEWFRQSRPRPIRAAPLVQLLLELCNRFRQGGLLTSHDAVACLRLHHLISVGQRASRPLAGNSRLKCDPAVDFLGVSAENDPIRGEYFTASA